MFYYFLLLVLGAKDAKIWAAAATEVEEKTWYVWKKKSTSKLYISNVHLFSEALQSSFVHISETCFDFRIEQPDRTHLPQNMVDGV